MFLDRSIQPIGRFGGGRADLSRRVDIAMVQSLYHQGAVKDFVTEYGQVIVDECHHISAFTFEQVMRQARAKYIVGLTATPTRKDGHRPIVCKRQMRLVSFGTSYANNRIAATQESSQASRLCNNTTIGAPW